MQEMEELQKGQQQKAANPVEAWPPELIFFLRAIELLTGVATSLAVRHPTMHVFSAFAAEALVRETTGAKGPVRVQDMALASLPQEAREDPSQCLSVRSAPLIPSRVPTPPPSTTGMHGASELGDALRGVLGNLLHARRLLGAQVCVRVGGEAVADLAAGKLGPVDPRPVQPDTAFPLLGLSCTVSALAAIAAAPGHKLHAAHPSLCQLVWDDEEDEEGSSGAAGADTAPEKAGTAGEDEELPEDDLLGDEAEAVDSGAAASASDGGGAGASSAAAGRKGGYRVGAALRLRDILAWRSGWEQWVPPSMSTLYLAGVAEANDAALATPGARQEKEGEPSAADSGAAVADAAFLPSASACHLSFGWGMALDAALRSEATAGKSLAEALGACLSPPPPQLATHATRPAQTLFAPTSASARPPSASGCRSPSAARLRRPRRTTWPRWSCLVPPSPPSPSSTSR